MLLESALELPYDYGKDVAQDIKDEIADRIARSYVTEDSEVTEWEREQGIQNYRSELRAAREEKKRRDQQEREKAFENAARRMTPHWKEAAKRWTQFEAESNELAKQNKKAEEERLSLENEQKEREQMLQSVAEMPDSVRFEHTLIIAPTGAGKTTLLYHELLKLIKTPNRPGVVIIDPKGTMVDIVAKFRLTQPCIVIDPTDRYGAPSFNLFKMTKFGASEAVENKTIELLEYAFSSREQQLTAKQATCFRAVCRLLLKLEEPNIDALFDILTDQSKSKKPSFDDMPERWKREVSGLLPITRRFFERDYYSNFGDTRDQIVARLYGVFENPALQRIFSAPENKLDMFQALQDGRTIIVNVPMALLGNEGSQLFARYMIALTFAAAVLRVQIPRSQWRPSFLFIDEFQEFADEYKTPELLRLAREFQLGNFMCIQSLNDLKPESLRASVLINSRIKYASSLTVDAHQLAKEMNCDSEFFHETHQTATHVRFACHVRGMTSKPAIIEIPKGFFMREGFLSDDEYVKARKANSAMFRATEREERTAPIAPRVAADNTKKESGPTPPPKAPPDPDSSPDWS